jgi:hypothetical protein
MHAFVECVLVITSLDNANVLVRVPKDRLDTAGSSDISMKINREEGIMRFSHVTGKLQVYW